MDAITTLNRDHWNHSLSGALSRAIDARQPFIYRHIPTGTFVDRAFVVAVLGSVKSDGATMSSREWEAVLIDGPDLRT